MGSGTVLKTKLATLSFLEFAVWGAYLTSLGIYLSGIGLGDKILRFYTVQGLCLSLCPL